MNLCHRKEATSTLKPEAYYDDTEGMFHCSMLQLIITCSYSFIIKLYMQYIQHQLRTCSKKLYQFSDSTQDFAHAFQKLTKPVLSSNIQSAVTKATSKIAGSSTDESPIPEKLLIAILKVWKLTQLTS